MTTYSDAEVEAACVWTAEAQDRAGMAPPVFAIAYVARNYPGGWAGFRETLAETVQAERTTGVVWFHVVNVPHVHPNNMWARRTDGLFEMAGSVYAFAPENVRPCVARDGLGRCVCPPRV